MIFFPESLMGVVLNEIIHFGRKFGMAVFWLLDFIFSLPHDSRWHHRHHTLLVCAEGISEHQTAHLIVGWSAYEKGDSF